MFKDTSEYAYLYTLCRLHDTLIDMIVNNEFTEEQLTRLLPEINYANEILNMNKEDLCSKGKIFN